MSSANRERPPRRAEAPGRRAASIARSIGWGFWWRKLVRWLCLDALLAALVSVAFVWHSQQSLAPSELDGITCDVCGIELVRPGSWAVVGTGRDPTEWVLRIEGAGGRKHDFPLEGYVALVRPFAAAIGVFQLLDLLDVFSDTRRVRRRLQPLNDLAAAAEAARAAAADPLAAAGDVSKMAALEAAIERTSIEAPQVTTGDAELAGIEGALNRLLRQMQEAKLQQMRFVSDASHELRTPIAVIQGYVNLLDRWGKTDAEVLDESIAALKAESEHMQELVEQLLFLARGDSGRNTLQRQRLNLAAIAREVWEESSMIDADHVYACPVGEGDALEPRFALTGDVAMIKQSMRIIVQNAAKYSDAGTTVTISVGAADDEVGYSVTDEGIGMEESDAAHVFERFWRADGARDEGAVGSGLGLSIAKWIVDAHGGTIEVLSRRSVGTRFTVRLPRG